MSNDVIEFLILVLWVVIFLITTRVIHERIADPVKRAETKSRFIGTELILMIISIFCSTPDGRNGLKSIFGPEPLGIPYWLFGPVFIFIVLSPLIGLLPHVGHVMRYDPRGPHPGNCPLTPEQLQRSYRMFLFGVVYFFLVSGAWILYSDHVGL